MTWEWALIVSVLIICLTVILCVAGLFFETEQPDYSVELSLLKLDLDKIRSEFESVAKTSEESKKLLSQANLAKGFTPRAPR